MSNKVSKDRKPILHVYDNTEEPVSKQIMPKSVAFG